MAATQTTPAGGPGFLTAQGKDGLAQEAAQAHAASGSAPGTAASGLATTAMVPVDPVALEEPAENIDEERQPFSPMVARLPVKLDVIVPVREFRVRNLLSLAPGQVIESQWGHGDDLPINAGEVALAWSEFEVIDTQLAVRITRLS